MKVNKEILSIYEEILTNNKNLISELNLVKLNTTNYSNLKYDNDATAGDSVNKALLDDLNAAAKSVGIIATITTASSGHSAKTSTGGNSRHTTQTAVDIAILDGEGSGGASSPTNGNSSFRSKGNKMKDALVSMGYSLNVESGNNKSVLWQTNTGGNHFNHLHVSNNSGESSGTPTDNTQSTDNSSDSTTVSGASSAKVSGASRDPMVSDVAGDIFGKVLGVTEQKTRKTKYFITFCNISDLKNYRNGQGISDGDVIGRTNTDVNVSKYDENYSKINLTEKEFRLGKDVNYSFGNATIPFSKNDKIKSPISGIVNNSKYISNCKNQLTIEVSGKIDIDNKPKNTVRSGEYRDPLVGDILSYPFKIFQNKYDDEGKLKQKRWGYSGEKVDPWIVDTISAPFKKIGSMLKEEETLKLKKLDENINNIKRLLK